MLRIEPPYSGDPASLAMNDGIYPALIILGIDPLDGPKNTFLNEGSHLTDHRVTCIGMGQGERKLFRSNRLFEIFCLLNCHGHRLLAYNMEACFKETFC